MCRRTPRKMRSPETSVKDLLRKVTAWGRCQITQQTAKRTRRRPHPRKTSKHRTSTDNDDEGTNNEEDAAKETVTIEDMIKDDPVTLTHEEA